MRRPLIVVAGVLLTASSSLPVFGQDAAAGGSFPKRFVGGFEQKLVNRQTIGMASGEMILTVAGKNIVWVIDDSDSDLEVTLPTPGRPAVPAKWYRPSGGDIEVSQGGTSTNQTGSCFKCSCTVSGSKTFQLTALPASAVKDFRLMVAADGKYSLTLLIPQNVMPFEATDSCSKKKWPSSNPAVRLASSLLGNVEGSGEIAVVKGTLSNPGPLPPGISVQGSWIFGGAGK